MYFFKLLTKWFNECEGRIRLGGSGEGRELEEEEGEEEEGNLLFAFTKTGIISTDLKPIITKIIFHTWIVFIAFRDLCYFESEYKILIYI